MQNTDCISLEHGIKFPATKNMPYLHVENELCFYRSAGNKKSGVPALILLHGSGGDSSVWNCQLPWHKEHVVLMPDLPGHGKSEGKARESVYEYARWLEGFVSQTGCNSFVLGGFSLGGLIAQAYAYIFPEKVRGLVLISTGMRVPIADQFMQLVRQDFPRAARLSCDNAYASGVNPDLYEHGLSMLLQNGPDIYYKDLAVCGEFDSSHWIHCINLPVLVICGREDTITPPELAQDLARKLQNATLQTVSGAAHVVMQECPDLFGQLVGDFVDRVFS